MTKRRGIHPRLLLYALFFLLFSYSAFHAANSSCPSLERKNSRISGSIVRAMASRILSGISDVPKRFPNILYLIRTNSCLRMLPYCRLQMSRQYGISCFFEFIYIHRILRSKGFRDCPNKVVWTQAVLAKPSVDTKTMLAKVMP